MPLHLLLRACLHGSPMYSSLLRRLQVQWETSVKTLLAKGLERSYEVGPGKVIAGIFKRVDKAHSITNVTA